MYIYRYIIYVHTIIIQPMSIGAYIHEYTIVYIDPYFWLFSRITVKQHISPIGILYTNMIMREYVQFREKKLINSGCLLIRIIKLLYLNIQTNMKSIYFFISVWGAFVHYIQYIYTHRSGTSDWNVYIKNAYTNTKIQSFIIITLKGRRKRIDYNHK